MQIQPQFSKSALVGIMSYHNAYPVDLLVNQHLLTSVTLHISAALETIIYPAAFFKLVIAWRGPKHFNMTLGAHLAQSTQTTSSGQVKPNQIIIFTSNVPMVLGYNCQGACASDWVGANTHREPKYPYPWLATWGTLYLRLENAISLYLPLLINRFRFMPHGVTVQHLVLFNLWVGDLWWLLSVVIRFGGG